MLMSRQGQVLRTAVDTNRSTGRAAQGVTIISMEKGDVLTGVALCPPDGDKPTDDVEAPTDG